VQTFRVGANIIAGEAFTLVREFSIRIRSVLQKGGFAEDMPGK